MGALLKLSFLTLRIEWDGGRKGLERSSTDLVLWGLGAGPTIKSDCPSSVSSTAIEFETSTAIGTFSEDLWLFILLVETEPSLDSVSSLLDFLEFPPDLFAGFSLLGAFSFLASDFVPVVGFDWDFSLSSLGFGAFGVVLV